MAKFNNKYRIETARAKWWDYKKEGNYFITICTKNRQHLFGHVENGEMILNEYGKIVSNCWYDLPNHYPNIVLDAFQIMPNHIHCIVGINNSVFNNIPDIHDIHDIFVETGLKPVCTLPVCTLPVCTLPVCTLPACTLPVCTTDIPSNNPSNIPSENPSNIPKKIKIHGVFEFMRALKSFSSRRINEIRDSAGTTNWQERFHDHIIRNKEEYERIKNYIINNPKKWQEDCFNKQ